MPDKNLATDFISLNLIDYNDKNETKTQWVWLMKVLFRILFSAFTLALLGMLYWSHLIIEERLTSLHTEIRDLKREIENNHSPLSSRDDSAEKKNAKRAYIDETEPNLLTEDPFVTQTLPKLLGENFKRGGKLREPTSHPEHLHPFNHFRDVSKIYSHCVPSLSEPHVGKFETFAPAAAIKIEARKNKNAPHVVEYWVHLRDNLFWQPLNPKHFSKEIALDPHFLKRHPITAYDFKFYYDAVMNPYVSEPKAASMRTYLDEIESFEIIDPLTFVVRWRMAGSPPQPKYSAFSITATLQPLPCFVYQYFQDGKKIVDSDDPDIYRKSSLFAQNFSNHFAKNVIVSAGPWLFDGMTDEGIHLKRNHNWYNPCLANFEEMDILFEASVENSFQDFKAGKLDLCTLAPTLFTQLDAFLESPTYQEQEKRGEKIEKIDYVDSSYSYIGWNQQNPLFASKKCRKAMTLAINRKRLISESLNERGRESTGPFHLFSSAYDQTIDPWPFNPELAVKLLEEEGWKDLDGDGIREKMIDGKKVLFKFNLIYFAKSQVAKSISEYISTSLREIGIACKPLGTEIADLAASFDDKSFDAISLGWSLGTPPEDPKQLWHSSLAHEKGSSNAVGFANAKADELIEKLNFESDKAKRVELYHAFHQIIHEEEPYTFLYFPKNRLLVRERVKNLFIPRERPDLIQEAEIYEPDLRFIYLRGD